MKSVSRSQRIRKVFLGIIACAFAGYFVVWFPWRLGFAFEITAADNPVDGMQYVSLLLLFLVGALAGWFAPEYFLLWGIATMAAFPIIASVQMFSGSTDHNLWPIEFCIYGVLTLPAIFGAALGGTLRNRNLKKKRI